MRELSAVCNALHLEQTTTWGILVMHFKLKFPTIWLNSSMSVWPAILVAVWVIQSWYRQLCRSLCLSNLVLEKIWNCCKRTLWWPVHSRVQACLDGEKHKGYECSAWWHTALDTGQTSFKAVSACTSCVLTTCWLCWLALFEAFFCSAKVKDSTKQQHHPKVALL